MHKAKFEKRKKEYGHSSLPKCISNVDVKRKNENVNKEKGQVKKILSRLPEANDNIRDSGKE